MIERSDLTDLLNERALMVMRDRLLGMAVEADELAFGSEAVAWFLLQAERAEILLAIAVIYRSGRRAGYLVPAKDRRDHRAAGVKLMAYLVKSSPLTLNALMQWR